MKRESVLGELSFLRGNLLVLVASYMVFGVVSAACFFFPGLKYYRQRGDKARGR